MAPECPICFSQYKEPVCLPCGHIYCHDCLVEHINDDADIGLTSTCPECQAAFNLVIPDLAYLHPKYHSFVSHAMRRVHADLAPDTSSDLGKKVKTLEERIASQHRTEVLLIDRCENLANERREAKKRAEDFERRLEEMAEKLERMQSTLELHVTKERNVQSVLEENSRLRAENIELRERLQEFEMRYETPEERRHELEMDAYTHLDEDGDEHEITASAFASASSVHLHASSDADTDASRNGSSSRGFSPSSSDWDSEWEGVDEDHERGDQDEDQNDREDKREDDVAYAQASARALARERHIKPLPRRRVSRSREREDGDDDIASWPLPPSYFPGIDS